MKTTTLIFGAVTAVTIASALSIAAFAWHPKGIITKKVQNVTTSSALSEADTIGNAVAAKPGDTLKYVIEIRNDADPADKNYNDMVGTTLTDTLPAGISLVSNPSQRTITENIGTLKPGQKATKEYLVKVTATTAGAITNTACFTGDSAAHDNPQKGCNPAVINVTVPVTPPTTTTPEVPTTPETPVEETPVTPELPAELPKTGAEVSFMIPLLLGVTVYAGYRFVASKRDLIRISLNR